MKLMFRETLKSLENYTNSKWTKNQDIKRSISKYVFNVDNDVINWFSKRQFIVTLFTCEIEYTRQILIAKEAIWLRNLMTQLTCDVEYSQTMMIYENNQSVIVLIKYFQFHARIKHIDIQTHFIKEKMIEEFIDLIYMFIDQMIIDDLTKSLITNKFVQFRVALKIESLSSQQSVFATAICESLSTLFATAICESLLQSRDSQLRKSNNESIFSVRARSSSHLITLSLFI
jgi:hypothetical protein